MRLSLGAWRTSGYRLTALAAALLLVGGFLFGPWVGLIGSRHGSLWPALIGPVVMAAALLDRWKPMRWFVMIAASLATPALAIMALMGNRPTLAYLAAAATSASIAMLLGSMPVHRWFAGPRDDWDSPEDASEPASATSPMLTAEKVEAPIPGVQRDAGSFVREARSNLSPDERK